MCVCVMPGDRRRNGSTALGPKAEPETETSPSQRGPARGSGPPPAERVESLKTRRSACRTADAAAADAAQPPGGAGARRVHVAALLPAAVDVGSRRGLTDKTRKRTLNSQLTAGFLSSRG